jgi:hypothetical protein
LGNYGYFDVTIFIFNLKGGVLVIGLWTAVTDCSVCIYLWFMVHGFLFGDFVQSLACKQRKSTLLFSVLVIEGLS